ncbi:RIP metalloprotease RseP [Paenibacillus darwinianus]|uniref:Zinc metalloprotease n=1 Tax=Paenibacillus darwinianus TaxID=1380763 RepID=A0A9W5W7Z2_9BACL|nr:RIP metalloprotease RseP [Paenibacillus darwinianus]EXX91261.1 RIP metalloprotease RseP [Paenibacillus darwinianus]EXX92216.1 RIP metalloprotease RseP [Paenibacillus darwinianus]EXX92812.1 RIP metalloprotease RseP [Paenibacillus darwinianus]
MEMVEIVLLTVLVFFVIVSIHEWGHFYFAKRAGILVREFAIGFGPKLFSLQRGETRYTLRLIPAGGFVRMAGEDPEVVEIQPGQTIAVRLENDQVTRLYLDRLDERSNVIRGEVESVDLERSLKLALHVEGERERYAVHPAAIIVARGRDTQIAPVGRQFGSKTVGQRALAIFAGPLMNFILAFVLFMAYIQMSGVPMENPDRILVGSLVDDKQSPAAKAGLQVGDEIQTINGQRIGFNVDKMLSLIGESADKPMKWIVMRAGQPVNITITPALDAESKTGKVGIFPAYPTRPASFTETFTFGAKAMKNMTINIFEGFKKLILGQFKLDDLGGPVKTAQVTSQIAAQGIEQLTSWTAVLSLYLGIFNLLPIPALDGSRLIFLGLEAVRGRPVDPNRESMVHFIGFAMLMLLMLAVTYNDILNLIQG